MYNGEILFQFTDFAVASLHRARSDIHKCFRSRLLLNTYYEYNIKYLDEYIQYIDNT